MTYVFNSSRFAQELKDFRTQRSISQEDLAANLNLSRSTISQIENGKTLPTREQLISICEKLDCGIEDFFYSENNDPVVFMMGNLTSSDRENLESVINRISIKMKYIKLHKRIGNRHE